MMLGPFLGSVRENGQAIKLHCIALVSENIALLFVFMTNSVAWSMAEVYTAHRGPSSIEGSLFIILFLHTFNLPLRIDVR